MKEPLNFLRKAIPYCKALHKNLKKDHPEYVAHAEDILQAAQEAVKFVMPLGGKIFESKLAGLPEIVKLPFDQIVIEYECTDKGGVSESVFGQGSTEPARKRIVYAEQRDDAIVVASIVAFQNRGIDSWQVQPYLCEIIPAGSVPEGTVVDDIPEIKQYRTVDQLRVKFFDLGGEAQKRFGKDWERHAYCDMADEEVTLLYLLEALTCKNVSIEALPVRKNKLAQTRGALPFDEYHALMVSGYSSSGESHDGTHRSPREHLRRGHIRRLPKGNVWVNSTIVNAGSHGKIYKSYEVTA